MGLRVSCAASRTTSGRWGGVKREMPALQPLYRSLQQRLHGDERSTASAASVTLRCEMQLAKTLFEFILSFVDPLQQAFSYFEIKRPKLFARHLVDFKFRHGCPAPKTFITPRK
jgi:hypothetical protein